MPDLWDPLTYETLMAGTVAHFEAQSPQALASTLSIEGPGVYALYYRGRLPEYGPIADGQHPLYIGKAIPPGARKGGPGNLAAPALRTRLRQHAKSIQEVTNLELQDFSFRALAILPVWIVFAEQALIQQYHPAWNTTLEGFGKHDQGKHRRATEPSWWDTLHPGRRWAAQVIDLGIPSSRTAAAAQRLLKDHFAEHLDR